MIDKQLLLVLILMVIGVIILFILNRSHFGSIGSNELQTVIGPDGTKMYKIKLKINYKNPGNFGSVRYSDGTSKPAIWNGIMFYLEVVDDPKNQNDDYIIKTQPTKDQIIKLVQEPGFNANGQLTSGPIFDTKNLFFSDYYVKLEYKSDNYNNLRSNYYASINNKNNPNNDIKNSINRDDLINNMKTWVEYYDNNNNSIKLITDKYYWFTVFLHLFIDIYKPYKLSNNINVGGIYKEYTDGTYTTPVEYREGVQTNLSTTGAPVYLQINKDTYDLKLPVGVYKFGVAIINDYPTIKLDSDRNLFPFGVSDFSLARINIDPSVGSVIAESPSGLTVEVIYYQDPSASPITYDNDATKILEAAQESANAINVNVTNVQGAVTSIQTTLNNINTIYEYLVSFYDLSTDTEIYEMIDEPLGTISPIRSNVQIQLDNVNKYKSDSETLALTVPGLIDQIKTEISKKSLLTVLQKIADDVKNIQTITSTNSTNATSAITLISNNLNVVNTSFDSFISRLISKVQSYENQRLTMASSCRDYAINAVKSDPKTSSSLFITPDTVQQIINTATSATNYTNLLYSKILQYQNALGEVKNKNNVFNNFQSAIGYYKEVLDQYNLMEDYESIIISNLSLVVGVVNDSLPQTTFSNLYINSLNDNLKRNIVDYDQSKTWESSIYNPKIIYESRGTRIKVELADGTVVLERSGFPSDLYGRVYIYRQVLWEINKRNNVSLYTNPSVEYDKSPYDSNSYLDILNMDLKYYIVDKNISKQWGSTYVNPSLSYSAVNEDYNTRVTYYKQAIDNINTYMIYDNRPDGAKCLVPLI
jgi:hypothetical protein